MRVRRTRPGLIGLAGALSVLALATGAFAATTNLWTNSVSGLWRTATNWSSNVPPNSTFTFILITNANNKTVTIDAGTPTTNLTIQTLTMCCGNC